MPDAVFTYDGNAGALYYRLTGAPVARTVGIDGRVMVDIDADGQVVGIEVLNAPGFSFETAVPPPVFACGHVRIPGQPCPHCTGIGYRDRDG